MRSPVTLYLRVRSVAGSWIYVKPVRLANHRLKDLYGIVDGAPKHFPEASYYLRYTAADGKRCRDNVGTDPDAAVSALQRKRIELEAADAGITLSSEVPQPNATPAPEPGTPGKLLKEAVKGFLAEMKAQRTKGTHGAYQIALNQFLKSCSKLTLEKIDRTDMLSFITSLRTRGNAPRTIRNKVDLVHFFLHHFELPSLLKGKHLPKFTRKKVRSYSELDLGKLFGAADQDETDLLYFLLCTGTRRQEACFACWSDIDLNAKTYTVTEHIDLGFRPKDKEEGSIPIPDVLVEALKARRQRHRLTRLIFPNSKGKPDLKLLIRVKKIALRAGLNCGFCTARRGKSCVDSPICKLVGLHKFRKTFASTLGRKGVAPRTLTEVVAPFESGNNAPIPG